MLQLAVRLPPIPSNTENADDGCQGWQGACVRWGRVTHLPTPSRRALRAQVGLPAGRGGEDAIGAVKLVPQTLLHTGAIVAVILAFVVYIFLWRTTIGYRIRAVGLNPDASRYAGIRVPLYQALALTLAGGFAGLAGVVEVIGVQHRLLEGITSGYGFSGIVAALFGGLHPLGVIPASYLFGSLLVGADKMQRAVQVPSSLVNVLLGLIVMFVVGSQYYARKRAARRVARAKASKRAAKTPDHVPRPHFAELWPWILAALTPQATSSISKVKKAS